MAPHEQRVIDLHFHAGLVGDRWPQWGKLSEHFQRQIAYAGFLAYARIRREDVSDPVLRDATERVIGSCAQVDRIVCLALDCVVDPDGRERLDRTHMWVANEYVQELQRGLPSKVLFGASVHPYRSDFEERVRTCVGNGAVLLKWLPSAMGIDLADPRIAARLRFLATARDGRPLPLLLHCGPEYAIPPVEAGSATLDWLSCEPWERLAGRLRWGRGWRPPQVRAIHDNLQAGLHAGATIIFAHCGFPYFASGPLGRIIEHSEAATVRAFLGGNPAGADAAGCSFADVSACCTPFRRPLFDEIRALPDRFLLFGSDFPTPVFELSAGRKEVEEDFRAVLRGELDRIIIPEDNLVDVNYLELHHFFPGHALFTNFGRLLL